MNDIAVKEFEKLKTEIIALYEAKGMRASGRFANSLEVVSDEFRVVLRGEDYAQQLESGRKGGTYPPIDSIKQWILDKGTFGTALQKISLSSLAFLIARKINNFGWKREGFGGVDLISTVITEQRINEIINLIGIDESVKFVTEIENLFKELWQ